MKNGYTPKEAAINIAIGWLRAAYVGKTQDVATDASTPAERRDLLRAIAKLHNKLLESSGLDGLPLDEEVEIQR